MVADIQLLQGKIIDDPEKRTQNIATLIDELAREFIAIQSLAKAKQLEVETAIELPVAVDASLVGTT